MSCGEGARRRLAWRQPRGELGSLLTVTYPAARLSDLVLSDDLAGRLRHVLLEQRQRDMLARHGLVPARRVLLIGPPGTGKTSTARVLAGELGLPLFSIRLDTIITKFMGETAAKLRLVFDALIETRGVYLFDEVDALAGDRAAANDVGEIRRVLNSFLQFLEEDASESVIVAATNHPRLLDNALLRRMRPANTARFAALSAAVATSAWLRPRAAARTRSQLSLLIWNEANRFLMTACTLASPGSAKSITVSKRTTPTSTTTRRLALGGGHRPSARQSPRHPAALLTTSPTPTTRTLGEAGRPANPARPGPPRGSPRPRPPRNKHTDRSGRGSGLRVLG